MKKIIFVVMFIIVACAPAPINIYPTRHPTPTLAINTRPIEDTEKEEALNFFYELKIQMALGEYEHFTEEVRYPITAKVDGQPKAFVFAVEFEVNFKKVFSEAVIQKFISTDESELTFTPSGVKVADGIIWFDLICLDPACENAEFLITEINN